MWLENYIVEWLRFLNREFRNEQVAITVLCLIKEAKIWGEMKNKSELVTCLNDSRILQYIELPILLQKKHLVDVTQSNLNRSFYVPITYL